MRQYPRQCFTLTPSFTVKEITITNSYRSYSRPSDYEQVASGKLYHIQDLFDTPEEAVTEGLLRVKQQQAKIDKMQANLTKKFNNLTAIGRQLKEKTQ